MSKKLYEMSLEELWEIFPIFLVEHNDEWETWYKDEKANFSFSLSQHVGHK